MTDMTHAQVMREVYLEVFDAFAVSPSDLVDMEGVGNVRFARELLATLGSAGLITELENVDGELIWQTLNPGTYDDHDRSEAEAVIDEWLASNDAKIPTNTPKDKTMTKDATEFKKCLCGCGENVPSKSFYRPGHDARHAGAVGREIAANYSTKGFDRRTLLDALPSDRLKAKAEAIAEKQTEKAERKAANKDVTGTVKVGKKAGIPAVKRGSQVFRTDVKEGEDWTEVSKSAASTFEPA